MTIAMVYYLFGKRNRCAFSASNVRLLWRSSSWKARKMLFGARVDIKTSSATVIIINYESGKKKLWLRQMASLQCHQY